jgi:hypothetical protein
VEGTRPAAKEERHHHRMTVALSIPSALTLIDARSVSIGCVVVCLALIWRFKRTIVAWLLSRALDMVVERYTVSPQSYGWILEHLRPRMVALVPLLIPLLPNILGSSHPNEGASTAMRVGEHLSVRYVYRGTLYVALLRYSSGVTLVSATARVEGQDKDVTEVARTYAGPCSDFHGQRLVPYDVVRGPCDLLTLSFSDGTSVEVPSGSCLQLRHTHTA